MFKEGQIVHTNFRYIVSIEQKKRGVRENEEFRIYSKEHGMYNLIDIDGNFYKGFMRTDLIPVSSAKCTKHKLTNIFK